MVDNALTAAILLGASRFPHHSYPDSPAFGFSCSDLKQYILDTEKGLALPDDLVLDLFDSTEFPSNQLLAIGRFLDRLEKQTSAHILRNLFVYYVGHGYFTGRRQDYQLALATLTSDYESTTGLKVAELGDLLKEKAKRYRKFIVLDCCFAAEALAQFQSTSEEIILKKTSAAFSEDLPIRPVEVPHRGTALLCAADKDSVAKSPSTLRHTMFSEALLEILRTGHPRYPTYLTLAEVCELSWELMHQRHAEPVRPVLHSPDQTEGDIAVRVPLFPNCRLKEDRKDPRSSLTTISAKNQQFRPTLIETSQQAEDVAPAAESHLPPSAGPAEGMKGRTGSNRRLFGAILIVVAGIAVALFLPQLGTSLWAWRTLEIGVADKAAADKAVADKAAANKAVADKAAANKAVADKAAANKAVADKAAADKAAADKAAAAKKAAAGREVASTALPPSLLSAQGKAELDSLVEQIKVVADDYAKRVDVFGYSRAIGYGAAEAERSLEYAEVVRSYLVAKGLPRESIHVEGRGAAYGKMQLFGFVPKNEGDLIMANRAEVWPRISRPYTPGTGPDAPQIREMTMMMKPQFRIVGFGWKP